MNRTIKIVYNAFVATGPLLGSLGLPAHAAADAVTDWDERAVLATKGYNGTTGTGVFIDSNLGSRVSATAARAVYDAVNAIAHFNANQKYYYGGTGTGSVPAAVAQAAHDVLLAQLPNPASDTTVDTRWTATRTWLDQQLASDLTALHVSASDGGVAVGKAAAAAAIAGRTDDNAAPVITYGPLLTPTSNPGVGLWRQSNAGASVVDPTTGAPTGFDAAGAIEGRPGIDLNWRDVTPFSLTIGQKLDLVAEVPLNPGVDSREWNQEADYVRKYGASASTQRSADQTAQALYYKQDAEIFVHEAARIASKARNLPIERNAALFALLSNVIADTRITAFASKYDQKLWRPITVFNADGDGRVTNKYVAWHPLAATPSHPSNTAGHSATGAAGFETLRAFFSSDSILPDGQPTTLGSLPWLVGTNAGTGKATTRKVTTFSQAQLENGASRLYLGVHWGFDNLQGQLLGLSVADSIITRSYDPASERVRLKDSPASANQIIRTLSAKPELYGYFGKDRHD
jgi:hypothetical protein